MIAAATGSKRSRGMVLFGKGWPVSGSRTVPAKIPLRSSGVGTRVMRVTPLVMRVPSKSAKKNALSFTMGPPRWAPYWFWSLAGLGSGARSRSSRNSWLKYEFESKRSSR